MRDGASAKVDLLAEATVHIQSLSQLIEGRSPYWSSLREGDLARHLPDKEAVAFTSVQGGLHILYMPVSNS